MFLNFSEFFDKLTSNKFLEKNEILGQCKGVHCVDLSESFQTHIYLQNFVSIQPRTSPVKFAASRDAIPSEGAPPRHGAALRPRRRAARALGGAGALARGGRGDEHHPAARAAVPLH